MKQAAPSSTGSFFMVGLPGLSLDPSTLALIRHQRINNFILFRRNVQDRAQLSRLTNDLRQACQEEGLAPPLIAIDQEGGTVTRLPPPFTQFAAARELGAGAAPEVAVREYARICGQELLAVGINMNLAPVLDLCPAGRGFFMEQRVLGDEPAPVAALGSLIIAGLQAQGVAACGKHFPGLGAAVVDPHHHLPVVTETKARLVAFDLPPFQAAVAAGVAAIMTSHTIYRHLDPENPATLSVKILTDLLRVGLNFDGVIVTDDLEMGAIENEGRIEAAALAAFAAGADLLLICHDHGKVAAAVEKLAVACQEGALSAQRLAASQERLRRLQQRFAISRPR